MTIHEYVVHVVQRGKVLCRQLTVTSQVFRISGLLSKWVKSSCVKMLVQPSDIMDFHSVNF